MVLQSSQQLYPMAEVDLHYLVQEQFLLTKSWGSTHIPGALGVCALPHLVSQTSRSRVEDQSLGKASK